MRSKIELEQLSQIGNGKLNACSEFESNKIINKIEWKVTIEIE